MSQLELRVPDDLDYLQENATSVLELARSIKAGNIRDVSSMHSTPLYCKETKD